MHTMRNTCITTPSLRDRLAASNVFAFGTRKAFDIEVRRLGRLGMSADRAFRTAALRFFRRVVE